MPLARALDCLDRHFAARQVLPDWFSVRRNGNLATKTSSPTDGSSHRGRMPHHSEARVWPSVGTWCRSVLFVPVPKACDKWRAANTVTRLERYPLPIKVDLRKAENRAFVSPVIDLQGAFYQIPVCGDVCKTAILRPSICLSSLVMRMGLRNAIQTVQWIFHYLFRKLDFFRCYHDDIWFSQTAVKNVNVTPRKYFHS